MSNSRKLSRRVIFGALAVVPTVSMATIAEGVGSSDAELVALGRQFDKIVRDLEAGDWADDESFARLDDVEKAILSTQATTEVGLCVKARAACWALLGDLDPTGEPTTDRRMALSIVRDLIRIHDPGLERPGAIRRLVEHP
jgi:hypothetical protein